jgi:putative oxidoreductase
VSLRSWFALSQLDRTREVAPFVLRLFTGIVLVAMSHDNVLSPERMDEFEKFLAQFDIASPALAARVSVYAQFSCGILLLLGAFTRWAALVMVVNFVVAILGVHTKMPLRTFLEPSAMLAASMALVFTGGGLLSIDRHVFARSTASPK